MRPDTNQTTDKVRENAARRWAKRHDVMLRKSRAKRLSLDNLGGYMLVDMYANAVVDGARFDLSLADVEDILRDLDENLKSAV